MSPQDIFPDVQSWTLQEASGEPAMEFRLLYRGPLKSDGEPKHKNEIRRCFHAQLAELWNQNTGLRALSEPGSKYKHKKKPQRSLLNKNGNAYNLLYLIGEQHGLSCALDILFLRRESAGGLVSFRGDLDNRLKTLFDALRAPSESNQLPEDAPRSGEDPFYCVLDDDKYIDKFTITTDRLLTPIDPRVDENLRDVLVIVNVRTIIFDNSKADWWVMSDRV